MEQLIAAQRELHGRIARTWENIKKLGSAKITIDVIRTALPLLEAKWKKFEEQHYQIMLNYRSQLEGNDYVTADFLGTVELAYTEQRAFLLQMERKAAGALTSSATKVETVAPRVSLPRIELPKFSGQFEDWPGFRDLFSSLVGDETTLPKVEKLHYLKSCVKGDAESLLRNLPPVADNYDRAWTILKEHYENTRLLVRSYLAAFTALPKMRADSAEDLREIFHGVLATVGALEGVGRPISSSEDLFVFLVVERLDQRTRREWESSLSETSTPPSYEVLRVFLQEQLRTQAAMQGIQEVTSVKTVARTTRTARTATLRTAKADSNRACPLCKDTHYLAACEVFMRKSPQGRREAVESQGRCCNCLGRHEVSSCNSEKTCYRCSGRHHTSLHDAYLPALRPEAPPFTSPSVLVAKQAPSECASVLLATARVLVVDSSGEKHSVRALLDSGSETSLVSESLAQRLRLPRTPASVSIFGIGGQEAGQVRGRVSLTFESRNGQFKDTVSSLVLPRLSAYSGAVRCTSRSWPHVRGLTLADPDFSARDPVELLLGADIFAALAMPGLLRGGLHEPVAQQTRLGWILVGNVGGMGAASSAFTALQCSCVDDLPGALRRFWEWEEPQPIPLPLTRDDEECERHFTRTFERSADGRFQVRLPFRPGTPELSATRRAAEHLCGVLRRRFARDGSFAEHYYRFMTEYEELGHMSLASAPPCDTESRICYLPHHGVRKPSEPGGKLRVVFNGSSSTPSGTSLNSSLYIGPNLLPALPDIVLQWRCHRYALVADVEKMYRQISLHPDDRDWQRILWSKVQGEAPSEFRLNTVTYGLACAPFLAIRALRQLADDEEARYPLGANALRDHTYMDDVLSGSSSLSSGRLLQQQLRELCMAGGFRLRKWAANHAALLDGLSDEDRLLPSSETELPLAEHSVLGLRWNPDLDELSVVVRVPPTCGFTKREIVSQVARLFDPLGWLAPVVVKAKLLIQTTWLQQLGWDAPLADEEARTWRSIHEELASLEEVRVPRWFQGADSGAVLEVHGFADASERAFAAAVYLRSVEGGSASLSLVLAKTKVAPLQRISLPRLELCAASLLAKLSAHVKKTLGLTAARTIHWSDSTVALHWIKGHPTRWTTFVANRVAEIHRSVPEAEWRHVSGKDNPADCASRGLFPTELSSHPLWWHGPPFLQEDESLWPRAPPSPEPCDIPEQRPAACLAVKLPAKEPEELLRFSSLTRLLRVTGWILRWTSAVTARPSATPRGLSSSELDGALRRWLQVAQDVAYHDELADLRAGRALSSSSPLRSLSPYLDENGILRVGGRLRHAVLSSEQRHPAVLPPSSHLTYLIIQDGHRRTLHGGVQATMAAVRQRFWAPRARQLVKASLRQCVVCARWRAATPQPRMGDLPASRVTPCRPFLHTGVDFAGPYAIRTSKGRGQKAYKGFLAVFICFSTRAVHLEVVSDYTSAAFLAAFRRFISRRGLCEVVYSDCGTNFVGADSELRSLFRASSPDAREIAGRLANDGVQWRFNPPSAPHFGGLWEAAVKSVKHHLRRVIGEHTLTYEEMSTLLAEIECCLNSRPLQALTDDPDDLEALTPGHFLIGAPMNAIPEPSLLDVSPNHHSRWRLLQSMRDHLWTRWSQEYLQSLTPRPKWWRTTGGLREGQLCIVRSENAPPTRWPLARVLRLHPGKDGTVRVVDVRTSKGELTRPVVKIVPLPSAAT